MTFGGWVDLSVAVPRRIADPCSDQTDRIKGPSGVTWTVQQVWSQKHNACLTDPTRPHFINDFGVFQNLKQLNNKRTKISDLAKSTFYVPAVCVKNTIKNLHKRTRGGNSKDFETLDTTVFNLIDYLYHSGIFPHSTLGFPLCHKSGTSCNFWLDPPVLVDFRHSQTDVGRERSPRYVGKVLLQPKEDALV